MNKHVAAAIALFAAPVAVMSGCSNQSSDDASTPTTSGPSAQKLSTQLNTADGKHVADATVDFTNGYATVTVETVAAGILSPGFHGVHIHAFGKCEANSVAPHGGQSGDFASAGDHFQAQGHTGQPASGDLPPLLARSDGSGKLVATSDGFTEDQLKGPEGSSIVLHEDADLDGQSGADQRLACGVLSPASATATSVSTSISTSVVTTTALSPVPPATVTETTPPTSPTPTTSISTSTSTVTVTSPTLTTTTPPPPG